MAMHPRASVEPNRPPLETIQENLRLFGGEVTVCTNVGIGIAVSILLPAENPSVTGLH